MKELSATIDIDASPDRVWSVLSDFGSYGEWNPFIRRIAGRPEEGARLDVRIEPPGGRAMTFKPTVLEAEPGRVLRWLGRLVAPGVFDGEHSFQLEPVGDSRTRFVQAERFTGVLVPLLGRALERTERGFGEMNEALKRRAEG